MVLNVINEKGNALIVMNHVYIYRLCGNEGNYVR